jgi:hypothetical protein
MAAHDEEKDLVLVLDVRSELRRAWISAASLYEAMNTIDEGSYGHRRWVTVTNEKGRRSCHKTANLCSPRSIHLL